METAAAAAVDAETADAAIKHAMTVPAPKPSRPLLLTDPAHDFFELLGLPEDCTEAQLISRWKVLSAMTHADKADPADVEAAKQRTKLLNSARDALELRGRGQYMLELHEFRREFPTWVYVPPPWFVQALSKVESRAAARAAAGGSHGR